MLYVDYCHAILTGLPVALPGVIIIIIQEFHGDTSLKQNFRATANQSINQSMSCVRLLSMLLLPMIVGGSMFQTLAAATGKAQWPMVWCNDRGTCNSAVDEDRRRPHESMSATRCSSLAR